MYMYVYECDNNVRMGCSTGGVALSAPAAKRMSMPTSVTVSVCTKLDTHWKPWLGDVT